LTTGIADSGGKFTAVVTVDLGKDVTTSMTPVVNLLPVSTKLVAHLEFANILVN
jgi:hypothetical protein